MAGRRLLLRPGRGVAARCPLRRCTARRERILDACASPGGKTTAMAAAMSDDRPDRRRRTYARRRVELLARTVAVSVRARFAYCGRTPSSRFLLPGFSMPSWWTLLGAWHHPARPRRQVAADGSGLRRASPLPSAGSWIRQPALLRTGGVPFTRPVPASRGKRRGRRCLPGGSAGLLGLASPGDYRKQSRRWSIGAVECALFRTKIASNRFSPRPWSKGPIRSKLQDSWHLRRAYGARASCSCSA